MDHRGRETLETEFMTTLRGAVVFLGINRVVANATLIVAGRILGHTGDRFRTYRTCFAHISTTLEEGVERSIHHQLVVFLCGGAPQATARLAMSQLVGLVHGEATGASSEGNQARHFA